MSLCTRRLAIAGVITAAAIAVPAAALASASPSGKPTVPPSAVARPAAAASKSAAAASGSPVNQSAAAAKAAAAASKSAAAGPGNRVDSMTGSAAVAALAGQLGISHSAARHALRQIVALGGQGGVDPADPAFGVIARDLGVSPARLAAALGKVKRALAGN